MKPYHPSGKVSIPLLFVALLVTIGSSSILGYIAYLLWLSVDKLHYFLSSISNEFIDDVIDFLSAFLPVSSTFVIIAFLYHCLLLFFATLATSSSLRWSKARNRTLLFWFGFLTAFIFQLSGYYHDFLDFQKQQIQMAPAGQSLPIDLSGYLQSKWNQDAVTFWMSLIFNSSIFHILAISAITTMNGNELFCEESGQWFGEEILIGFVSVADIDRLDEILNTDRFDEIDFTIESADIPLADRVGHLAIYIRTADKGEVKSVFIDVKKIARKLDPEADDPIYFCNHRSGFISSDNYQQLRSAISTPALNS